MRIYSLKSSAKHVRYPDRSLSRCILLTALAALTSFSTSAKTFHVSNNGNDSNSGSLTHPIKTIDAANKIRLRPGDQLLFNGGDRFDGTLQLNLRGEASGRIIISSYGTGRATIHGLSKEAISLQGQYFELRNIDARGSGRKNGSTSAGIQIYNAKDIIIDRIRVEEFQKSGLSVSGSTDIEIRNIHAVNNGFAGIFLYQSQYGLIKDCLAENNPGDPTNLTNHSGNGILVGESKNILIEHCVATQNGWDMPRTGNGPVGIWAYQADSVTIQYCIAYQNKTAKGAKDGGGFDLDGGVTHSVIQYCLAYENEGAGYGLFQYYGADKWSDNVLRYCISYNDGQKGQASGGIFVWNGDKGGKGFGNAQIYHNVVFNDAAPAVRFDTDSEHQNFGFYNNIFLGRGDMVSGPSSGDKFQGNIWWKSTRDDISFRGYKDLLSWANANGQEKTENLLTGKVIDPQFKGPLKVSITDTYQLKDLISFRLSSQSGIIDSGLDLKKMFDISLPAQDFFGNPTQTGLRPDPGIAEFKKD